MANDPVNHPSHYTYGKYEVIDFIEHWGLGYHLGNAVKYISRAGKKSPDTLVEDLQKAAWYLNRARYCPCKLWYTAVMNIAPDDYCKDKKLSENLTKAIKYIVQGQSDDAHNCVMKEIDRLKEKGAA